MTFNKAHRLIKSGNLVALRQELDGGLSPKLSNKYSWTLVMLAAIEGNVNVAMLLISKGADIHKANKFGETALSLAAHQGHEPFIKMLLAEGASVDCYPHGHSLEDWIRSTSGLPESKVRSVMRLLRTRQSTVDSPGRDAG